MIESAVSIYGNLNTLIQLIAAIYITIALDDVLFNRFWTPNIYKTTISILKKYNLVQPTVYETKFKRDLELRFRTLESITRKRGFFNVSICIFFLIYNALLALPDFNMQYPFIIYMLTFIFVYAVILFSGFFFKRGWSLCLCLVILLIILSCGIKFFNNQNYSSPTINNISESIKILVVVFLLILPILYQLLLTWIYSKGYSQYLQYYIDKEASLYNKAKEALIKHDDTLIPEEYKNCFATTALSRTQDIQLTRIDEHLYDKLKKICCDFSLWDIIGKVSFKETIKNRIIKGIPQQLTTHKWYYNIEI